MGFGSRNHHAHTGVNVNKNERVGRSLLNKGLSILTAAGLALGGITLGASAANAADELAITDPGLLAAVNKWIHRTRPVSEPVTVAEAQSKLSRDRDKRMSLGNDYEIQNFNGLEVLTEIKEFQAAGTFTNIDPLVGLPNLESLSLTSPNLGPALPQTAKNLTSVTLNSENLTDLTEVQNLGLGTLQRLDLQDTRISNLNGFENLNFAAGAQVVLGAQNDQVYRSEISDLTPLRELSDVRLKIDVASITDLAPLKDAELQSLNMANNHITDISMLPIGTTNYYFGNQQIALEEVPLGETVTNPVRDLYGETVEVTSTSSGFKLDDDGNFFFTEPGNKSLRFTWKDPDYSGTEGNGVFSGSMTIMVSAGTITGEVIIPSETGVGQTLTAEISDFEPDDVDLSFQWYVDGEPVNGATGPNYVPAPSDPGKTITVEVIASKSGHASHTATSNDSFVAIPAIAVSPNTVKPGEEVGVAGDHYAPGEDVELTLPGGSTVITTANEHGSFTTTVKISEGAADGSFTVTGAGVESGLIAEDDLTVLPLPEASTPEETGPEGPENSDPSISDEESSDTGTENLTLSHTGSDIPVGIIAIACLFVLAGAGALTGNIAIRRRGQ